MRGCLGDDSLSIPMLSLSSGWPSPPTLCLLSEIPTSCTDPVSSTLRPPPHPHPIPHPILAPLPCRPPPMACAQPQTSTSCGPGTAAVAATPMSKQVTIMTWALHRLTHCSRAAVACSRAARYSADSGSSSGSTSTGERRDRVRTEARTAARLKSPKEKCQLGGSSPSATYCMGTAEGGEGRDSEAGSGLLHLLGIYLSISVSGHRGSGALTLLQPAPRLHHQPALGLSQLLTEVVTFGLHLLQPLLSALR